MALCYTNTMKKLSVVIMAFNEEEKIRKCLESVRDLSDEIIVVDNGSIDKTALIARKYTKLVYKQKNEPQNIDILKNFGFGKVKGEWILSLDADERVSESLALQIKAAITNEDAEISAYMIPRKNFIFGKWMQHAGWYPDFQTRLFRNGKGRYISAHVHEDLHVDGKTDQLTEPILHMNYDTIIQFYRKHLAYAENEAQSKMNNGYVLDWKDALRFPLKEFLSRFFAREGYKDGFHGLMLSLLMGVYHLMIFSYIWEKEKFVEAGTVDLLSETGAEVRTSYKELMYWFVNEKVKRTKSISQKFILKLQRKFS